MNRRNISLLALLVLLLCSTNVNAQGPRFGQPEMPGGMKDSYKDFFTIGVAVNISAMRDLVNFFMNGFLL